MNVFLEIKNIKKHFGEARAGLKCLRALISK